MTMSQNIKHSKHKDVRGFGYRTYDNYEAIEVPYTDAIPSDYDGVTDADGVPKWFDGLGVERQKRLLYTPLTV